MKYPPHIESIKNKWLSVDYVYDSEGNENTYVTVANADVSVLLVEIGRLMREVEELKKALHGLNGKG